MRDDLKVDLINEKNTKLLEEVMEKGTYKVAMHILEKFGKIQPAPKQPAANIKGVPRESAAGAGGLVDRPAGAGAHGEVGNLRR